jgi:hypothetical protein
VPGTIAGSQTFSPDFLNSQSFLSKIIFWEKTLKDNIKVIKNEENFSPKTFGYFRNEAVIVVYFLQFKSLFFIAGKKIL